MLQCQLDAFKHWLQGFEPGMEVGRAGSTEFCPLARFFSDQGGKRNVEVYLWYVQWELVLPSGQIRSTRARLPYWARRFIRRIEEMAENQREMGGERSISREQALSLLEEIECQRDG